MEVSIDTDEFDDRFYSFRMGKDREMDDGVMNVNEGAIFYKMTHVFLN